MKVGTDRFCLRATMEAFAARAREVSKAAPDGLFTAAQFRDAIGATRAIAIPGLETLDRLWDEVKSGQ